MESRERGAQERAARNVMDLVLLASEIHESTFSTPDKRTAFCSSICTAIHSACTHFPAGVSKDEWYTDHMEQLYKFVVPFSMKIDIRVDVKSSSVSFSVFEGHPKIRAESQEMNLIIVKLNTVVSSISKKYGMESRATAMSVINKAIDTVVDRAQLMREAMRCMFDSYIIPVSRSIIGRLVKVRKPEIDPYICQKIDKVITAEDAVAFRIKDEMYEHLEACVSDFEAGGTGSQRGSGPTLAGMRALRALMFSMSRTQQWRRELSVVPVFQEAVKGVEMSFPRERDMDMLDLSLRMGLDRFDTDAFKVIAQSWIDRDSDTTRNVYSWNGKVEDIPMGLLTDEESGRVYALHPSSVRASRSRKRRERAAVALSSIKSLPAGEEESRDGVPTERAIVEHAPLDTCAGADGCVLDEEGADELSVSNGDTPLPREEALMDSHREGPASSSAPLCEQGEGEEEEEEEEEGEEDEDYTFGSSNAKRPRVLRGGKAASRVEFFQGGAGRGANVSLEQCGEASLSSISSHEEGSIEKDGGTEAEAEAEAGTDTDVYTDREQEQDLDLDERSAIGTCISSSTHGSSGILDNDVARMEWVDGINLNVMSRVGAKSAKAMLDPSSSNIVLWRRITTLQTRHCKPVSSLCVLEYAMSPECNMSRDEDLPSCVSFARRILKAIVISPTPCVESWPSGEGVFSSVMFPYLDYRRVRAFYIEAGVGERIHDERIPRWYANRAQIEDWRLRCEKLAVACLAFYVARSAHALVCKEGDVVTMGECISCTMWALSVLIEGRDVDLERQGPRWVRVIAGRCPKVVGAIHEGCSALRRVCNRGILRNYLCTNESDSLDSMVAYYRTGGKNLCAAVCDSVRHAVVVAFCMMYMRTFSSSRRERHDLVAEVEIQPEGEERGAPRGVSMSSLGVGDEGEGEGEGDEEEEEAAVCPFKSNMVSIIPTIKLSAADLKETMDKMARTIQVEPAGWKIKGAKEEGGASLPEGHAYDSEKHRMVVDRKQANIYTIISICEGISKASPLINFKSFGKLRDGTAHPTKILPPSVIVTPWLFSRNKIIRRAAYLGLGQMCSQNRPNSYDWSHGTKTVLEPTHPQFGSYDSLPVILSVFSRENIIKLAPDPFKLRRSEERKSDPPYFQGSYEKFVKSNPHMFSTGRGPAPRSQIKLPRIGGHGRTGRYTQDLRVSTLNQCMHVLVASFLSMRLNLYTDRYCLSDVLAACKKYYKGSDRDAVVSDLSVICNNVELSCLPESARGLVKLAEGDSRIPNAVFWDCISRMIKVMGLNHRFLSEEQAELASRYRENRPIPSEMIGVAKSVLDKLNMRRKVVPLLKRLVFSTNCASDIYVRKVDTGAYDPLVVMNDPVTPSNRRAYLRHVSRFKAIHSKIEEDRERMGPGAVTTAVEKSAACPPNKTIGVEEVTKFGVRNHTGSIEFAMGNAILMEENPYDIRRYSEEEIDRMTDAVECLSRIACSPDGVGGIQEALDREDSISDSGKTQFWKYSKLFRDGYVIPFAIKTADCSPVYHTQVQAFSTSPYIFVGNNCVRETETGLNFSPFMSPSTMFIDFVTVHAEEVFSLSRSAEEAVGAISFTDSSDGHVIEERLSREQKDRIERVNRGPTLTLPAVRHNE